MFVMMDPRVRYVRSSGHVCKQTFLISAASVWKRGLCVALQPEICSFLLHKSPRKNPGKLLRAAGNAGALEAAVKLSEVTCSDPCDSGQNYWSFWCKYRPAMCSTVHQYNNKTQASIPENIYFEYEVNISITFMVRWMSVNDQQGSFWIVFTFLVFNY